MRDSGRKSDFLIHFRPLSRKYALIEHGEKRFSIKAYREDLQARFYENLHSPVFSPPFFL